MNQSKKVVEFTLAATLLFFICSIYISYSKSTVLSLDKISIVSDIFSLKKPVPRVIEAPSSTEREIVLINDAEKTQVNTDDTQMNVARGNSVHRRTTFVHKQTNAASDTTTTPPIVGDRSFGNYLLSKALTNFSKDTTMPALPDFMQKLVALKKGKKEKVRIAWFGDSMIEGDLLTKTFRKRMQQFFGGYGVGFVPATSITSAFRNTIIHKWKGEWKEESFKTIDPSQPLYLSGHTFFTGNGELTLTDKTVPDTTQPLEKSLICGSIPGTIDLTVNGITKHFSAGKRINRLVLDTTNSHNVDVVVNNNKLPVYGISIEPHSGVVVDNFSFRGITGLELGKLDSSMLSTLETENNYDLVILEYGANLMFRPDDMDYSWYRKHIINVVSKLQKAMPHTEFLVISTADRAFCYNNSWKTATGIDNLIKTQAELAYNNDAAFYNMYKSMGGSGTIVQWAEGKPQLANRDYIHPNFLGADILGNMLYEAFMKDFKKAGKLINTQL